MICEDKTNAAETTLVYANRPESDIPMRNQLDHVPAQLVGEDKVYFMLDKPTSSWTGGVGFVNMQVMEERLLGPAKREIVW